MKRFRVVAYKRQRYEMEVEAEYESEAEEVAAGYNGMSPLWIEDEDYYSFDIERVEEVVEEGEEE